MQNCVTGLKQIQGISQVCMRKSRDIVFVISRPEVYKGTSETYVVIGEAKVNTAVTPLLQCYFIA